MLGATLAGIGFGAAGCHVPHACSYGIASVKHEFVPAGYPDDHPFVPHGVSVIVTAPATFRRTFDAAPERHLEVASLLLGEDASDGDAETLPAALISLMQDIDVPERRRGVRLRRGRHRRPRRQRDEAAAPARAVAGRDGSQRPGRDPPRVDGRTGSARAARDPRRARAPRGQHRRRRRLRRRRPGALARRAGRPRDRRRGGRGAARRRARRRRPWPTSATSRAVARRSRSPMRARTS